MHILLFSRNSNTSTLDLPDEALRPIAEHVYSLRDRVMLSLTCKRMKYVVYQVRPMRKTEHFLAKIFVAAMEDGQSMAEAIASDLIEPDFVDDFLGYRCVAMEQREAAKDAWTKEVLQHFIDTDT